jgi:hypothetical protein
MDDDKAMVSITDALAAVTSAVQWVGDGWDPDDAVQQAAERLRLEAKHSGQS